MSRPETPINWNKCDELLMAGCPGTEVAAFFGIHEETFYDRVVKKFGVAFSAYKAEKQATGEALMRMQQYNKAMGVTNKGDNTLLIFLGKQRLGQRENPNDKVAPEEVLKAFNDLMKQIDRAQSERLKVASHSEDSLAQCASIAVSQNSSNLGVANPSSISVINHACKESPFR